MHLFSRSSAFASSAISISFVVVSSPLRACVNTSPISTVVHVVSFDVRAARFARVTSPISNIACSSPLYDFLGLSSSCCGSSRSLLLQLYHHLAAQPLLYCKIKKSHNALSHPRLHDLKTALHLLGSLHRVRFTRLDQDTCILARRDRICPMYELNLEGSSTPPLSELHHLPSAGGEPTAYPHPTHPHST